MWQRKGRDGEVTPGLTFASEPDATSYAVGYAKFYGRSHEGVILNLANGLIFLWQGGYEHRIFANAFTARSCDNTECHRRVSLGRPDRFKESGS